MNRWSKLVGVALRPRYWRGLPRGVAASLEHEAYLSRMEFRTVVDIGANRGQFSLLARSLWPGARIVALEPLEQPAKRFNALFQGDERTVLHRVALGPQREQREIYIAAKDDSSSLLPIGARQLEIFPGTQMKATRPVQVAPLSSVLAPDQIEPPALLKLDVQGYELEAMKGCGELLGGFVHIIAECSFVELYEGQALAHEIVRYMDGRGFRLHNVYNLTVHGGRAIQAEFAFVRRASDEPEPASG